MTPARRKGVFRTESDGGKGPFKRYPKARDKWEDGATVRCTSTVLPPLQGAWAIKGCRAKSIQHGMYNDAKQRVTKHTSRGRRPGEQT